MKPVVTRNLMLDFIKDTIVFDKFNHARTYKLNDKEILSGDIFYVMSREFRVEDNWGLIFAYEMAKNEKKKLKVILFLDSTLCSSRQCSFRDKGIELLKRNLTENNIAFETVEENIYNHIKDAGACILDFNPIVKIDWVIDLPCGVYEVDSHNIIPARFISDKQEFSAATIRRKIYGQIGWFLTEFPTLLKVQKTMATELLEDFIAQKLENYAKDKNDPNKDAVSNLSKYLHFGFISAQRIAIEVLKSDVSRENKEVFLEELIVRKELSDNFCLYTKNHKTLDGILDWAKVTLDKHKEDIRTYIYTKEEFENSKTHDELWNAIQSGLLNEGRIHGYLRMYWAKKILEWSLSPEEALATAIYLNDEYALDGNDPNGYVGILWSIGGLHDRPFANRLITGKIRYMSYEGCKKKFDIKKYLG